MRTALLFLFTSFVLFASAQSQTIAPSWIAQAPSYFNGGPMTVNSIVTCSDGSVVAAGYFTHTADFAPGTDSAVVKATGKYNIFIAKYSKAGKLVYVYHFGDSTSGAMQAAYSVTADSADNIYVTGNFNKTIDFNPGTGTALLSAGIHTEIFIASYDKNGAFRYAVKATATNGTTARIQTAYSIVTDKTKNVYITGSFRGKADFNPGASVNALTSKGKQDIFFAKYDSSGGYVFANSIGGSDEDVAKKAVLDKAGNIIICGQYSSTSADFDPGTGTAALSSNGKADIFFAKYDPMGNYVFANSISGSGDDVAGSVAVNNDNSVLVTGYFTGKNVDFDAGAGTYILNGTAFNGDAFVTKYTPAGAFSFAFKIGASNEDGGTDIITDGTGNFFVAGYFSGSLVDFDPGTSVYSLNTGHVTDEFIAKYTGAGALLFAEAIGNADGSVSISSLALDRQNNLYTGGYFSDTLDIDPGAAVKKLYERGQALLIAKYNSSGTYLNSLNGDAYFNYYNSSSTAEKSITDAAGNVYIAGFFNGRYDFDPGPDTAILESSNDNHNSIYFAKYSNAGKLIFAKAIRGTYIDCNVYGLVIDAANNIYLAGYASNTTDFDPGTGVQYWTDDDKAADVGLFFAKYSSSGNLVFAKGLTDGYAYPSAITLDAAGNIYMSGFFSGGEDFDPTATDHTLTSTGINDGFVAKYDNNGKYVFAVHNGTADAFGSYEDIKLNSKGEIVVCGFQNFEGAGILASYKSDGTFLRSFVFEGTTADYAEVDLNSLAIDASDNIFVGGFFRGSVDFDPGNKQTFINAPSGLFLASYTRQGALRFAKGSYAPVGVNVTNTISGIALDKGGNVYTTGYFSTDSIDLNFDAGSAVIINENSDPASYYPNTDLFLAKYDNNGKYLAGYDFDGTAANELHYSNTIRYNTAGSISVDAAGNIFLAGSAETKLNLASGTAAAYISPFSDYSDLFLAKYLPISSTAAQNMIYSGIQKTGMTEGKLSVYPNPASDYLKIRIANTADASGNANISIYNAAGVCAATKVSSFANHAFFSTMDVHSLLKGEYFIHIKTGSAIYTSSFVIQ